MLDRLLQPGAFALQHAARLVVVPGLGQPTVVGAQGGQETGQLAVARCARCGLGQRTPPALAPPQLRSRAGVDRAGLRQPGQLVPARRGQCAQLGAAQRGPVVVERVQAAAAGVPHPSQLVSLVPVERLGEPRRGPHQPGRVAAVAGGRRPQLRRVVPPRVGRGPTGEQPRDWRVLRPRLLESAGQLFGALGERRPLRAGPSPGREHHQLRPVARDLASLAPEARCGRAGPLPALRWALRGPARPGPGTAAAPPGSRCGSARSPAARPQRRRPRRGARRRAAPGSGPRRARRARRPSAHTRRPPRRTASAHPVGHRSRRPASPGCARPAPPRGPDPRPRRSGAPRRARARHARRRRRRGRAGTSRPECAPPRSGRQGCEHHRGRPEGPPAPRRVGPGPSRARCRGASSSAPGPAGRRPRRRSDRAHGARCGFAHPARGQCRGSLGHRRADRDRRCAPPARGPNGAHARPRRSDLGRAARCPGHGTRPTASTGRRTPKTAAARAPSPGQARRWPAATTRRPPRPPGCWASGAPSPTTP